MLEAGMRQHAVADQDAETAVVEEGLVHAGNAVDHGGKADGVVGPPPLLAGERQPGRDGAVDVGELIRLDIAIRPAGARKDTEPVGDLLFEIGADPAAALVLTNRRDVGWAASDRG